MLRAFLGVPTLAACFLFCAMPGTALSAAPDSNLFSAAHPLLVRMNSAPLSAHWEFFRSPSGRFTAWFPTTPVVEISSDSDSPSKIVQSTTGSAAYMLMYSKLGAALSNEQRKKALSGAVHAAEAQGKVISIRSTIYQGYSARDVILRQSVDGSPVIMDDMIFIAHNYLYQVMTVIPLSANHRANTRMFQRSFRLVRSR